MDHPFIVSMDGFTQNERYLYLVLEFVSGGELFTYLRCVGRLDPLHAAYNRTFLLKMINLFNLKSFYTA